MIYGTCMGGSSGMYAVSWIKEVEKHGIPSLYLVGEMYMPDIENTCKTQGFPAMRRVEVPIVWDQYIFEQALKQNYDFSAKWLGFGQLFARKEDEEGPKQTREMSAKVVVVGGQTSQQVAQAWHANQPTIAGIDKWR